MMNPKLLDKETELKALRLLRSSVGIPKSYHAIVNKVRKSTIAYVVQHAEVAAKLEGRHFEVVGADLKPMRNEGSKKLPQRIGEVGIYDYSTNTLLVQEVDLKKGTLLELHHRKGIQPPLNENELAEAKRIALSHRAYAKHAKEKGLQMVTSPARVSFTPGHPARGHRVFTIYFWSAGKNPKRLAEAVVDLSESKVLGKENFDDAVIGNLIKRADNDKLHGKGNH
jgi:Cu2+-containing amine oxidase